MLDDASRLDRTKLCEHLAKTPGQRPSDVARTFDVHPSTAEYHLRRLESQGRVARERVGRELFCYPTGAGWCRTARAVHARLTPAARSVLRVGLDRRVFPRQRIIREGFSSSAVRWAMDRLVEVGVLERLAWGVYELVEGTRRCVIAALREERCRGCNDAPGREDAHVRRATSRPSPSGRMDASRSG